MLYSVSIQSVVNSAVFRAHSFNLYYYNQMNGACILHEYVYLGFSLYVLRKIRII